MRLFNSLIIFGTFLLTSCAIYSNVTYKEWSSDQVYHGEGGAMSPIGQYEYWEYGSPQRDYKILGIIEQKSLDTILLSSYNKNEIIKQIETVQGNGVIQISKEKHVSGFQAQQNYGAPNTYNLNPTYRSSKALLVFSYVE